MRILGGEWKGRSLEVPKGKAVRPTTARVRQRLFDTLASYWQDSIGIDAFAGSGILGFEALSRGALQVFAVEVNAVHYRCIEANCHTLSSLISPSLTSPRYQLTKSRFETWWKRQTDDCIASVDWIYLDPPYGYEGLHDVIRLIVEHSAVREGILIIVEHGNSPSEKATLHAWLDSKQVSLFKQIDCGDTGVWILETT